MFRARFNPILHRLTRQVFDSEIAVDLTAETLAAAFIQRSRFRGTTDGEAVAWLNGIADHKLAMFFRRRRVERRALSRLGIDPPVLTEEEHNEVLRRVDGPLIASIVRRGLASLSDAQRVALTLRVVEEMPYADMADRLGSRPIAWCRTAADGTATT
ncbi:MAG: hypothetical protein IT338_16055 [Thermomicrobiales bacterium]|nr:hypothetical protein [Thermomicrobiales bacterium]